MRANRSLVHTCPHRHPSDLKKPAVLLTARRQVTVYGQGAFLCRQHRGAKTANNVLLLNGIKKRNRIVKTKLSVLMLLAAGAVFAQFSVGIRIGAPPPVRVVRVQPRSPG